MIRRPPRSTLFPTRRSSDLDRRRIRRDRTARDARPLAVLRLQPIVDVARRSRGDRAEVAATDPLRRRPRSEEHTSELQSLAYLVCRLLLEKKKHKDMYALQQ